MQFLYHPLAGEQQVLIQNEQYTHLYKSRRTKQNQTLTLRNLRDPYLYLYEQALIERRSATLLLKDKILSSQIPKKQNHIILSIIDFKVLQKTLPFLNELGLSKLTLFYADFSQRNEKIDLEKLQKILIHSCEQCGRSNLLEIELCKNLSEVLQNYPQIGSFNFGGEKLKTPINFPILIGPEGGFSPKEQELLKPFPTFSTEENLILRSESACVYVASLLQAL